VKEAILFRKGHFIVKNKKGRRVRDTLPPENGALSPPKKNKAMIIHEFAKLNEIFEKGRDYPWKRPSACPGCNCHKIWGHGYVGACFDGFAALLWLRRYRCPDCGCVIRLRPRGFFSRFQAPVATIRRSIANRLHEDKWLPGISRTRQAHWFRALGRRVAARFGSFSKMGLVAAFDRFVAEGVTPVSRSI
jgi:hypothetical protein